MIVNVTRITIPAWSTIGYGEGTTDDGEAVGFIGDHRPMRDIGEMLRDGSPVVVTIDGDQLIPVEMVRFYQEADA